MTDSDQQPPQPQAPGLAEYQNEIYLRGLGGETPAYPVSASGLEQAAYGKMTPEAVGYVAGGAGSRPFG